ncbi:aspartate/glutamate racemase family protein [Sporomusa sp. KB1]|jgi:aspartate racemase|uniref:aspartate/glutamate racemase family protein n=1 Tax=Sporomusa sp. KB1 TaxID=943346 RepID=UPI0011A429C5|nr:amino acid racemase [Sporomusa sp. KB1]TWH45798.1 aspartate racemase [Sporomusa sp. KB1]
MTGERKCFGIIGGLGALASADFYNKLVKSIPNRNSKDLVGIVIEQHPFAENDKAGDENANLNARKLYVFDMLKEFERRKVNTVILPCFICHTFFDELVSETELPVINIMEALHTHIFWKYSKVRKLGILTSDFVRKQVLFEHYFATENYELLYPNPEAQKQLMQAVYGETGIRSGLYQQSNSLELLIHACQDLIEQGADLIVPGFTELAFVTEELQLRGMPIFDVNQVYAQYAIDSNDVTSDKAYKIGIVGGVGPSATVDFMDKIIRNTDAKKDQEHIKMVVEHNPQIPDRTRNLIGDGPDPTIALYSACKKLESNDANIIAIPCNTAHAFVKRIQPYLSIPIINMLYETVEHIKKYYNDRKTIGLLATDGTIKSKVYHEVVAKTEFSILVPEEEYQAKVMNAIYGEKGVKAGYTAGVCKTDLLMAVEHLVQKGAEIIILGCTELPLLLSESPDYQILDKSVAVLDPTEILARKCVSLRNSKL